MKKSEGRKSRATVPLRQLIFENWKSVGVLVYTYYYRGNLTKIFVRMPLYMILRGFLMKYHMQNKNLNYIANSNWYSNRL
jgi:hypothetical protein